MWWAVRDYATHVWDNSGDDNIFFLAGGIAFNILLAAVPFLLLLLSGLGYLLNLKPTESSAELWLFIDRFLPPHAETADSPVHKILNDIITSRGRVGVFGLIGFVWFSTRLFGSLRTVLQHVFDIDYERGIIEGKLFDIKITVVGTLLFVAYSTLSAYLSVATTRGVGVLVAYGIRKETMGTLEYVLGRVIASVVIMLMFYLLYKYLPKRRVRWRSAALAALVTGAMFELAKQVFTVYVRSFNPSNLYSGTIAALVLIVFWTYYAALIFIIGGEVGQVYELRRVRRLQREEFS